MAPPASVPNALSLITTSGFRDYALIDSGAGRKLERFGDIIVDRPEPQALWQPRRGKPEWSHAHAVFSASAEDDEKGRWRIDRPVPDSWRVALTAGTVAATMICRLQGLWHLGLFPEQHPHWVWTLEQMARLPQGERPRVLNLFGYTGAASLLAAAAGAEVVHVDASKKAIQWGKENQAASGLADKPIRWMLDDAQKFVAREVRRGRDYHVILVDPPKFGRGPDGEIWDLFHDLPPLLDGCAKLLAGRDASMVLTVYAIRASALAFGQLVGETLAARPGNLDVGELAIVPAGAGLAVPTSLYVRWSGAGTP